jgi:hypothetical protein
MVPMATGRVNGFGMFCHHREPVTWCVATTPVVNAKTPGNLPKLGYRGSVPLRRESVLLPEEHGLA